MIKRLKEIRVEKKINQKEIAALLNITQQTYSDYETGRTNPDIETLIRISNILETSIDYLLGFSDELGVINIYRHTDNINDLSSDEQKIVDAIRKTPPLNATEWVTWYVQLPSYMQESIFAELRGMYLGFKASKADQARKSKF